jgi:hypothetical protein
MNPERYCDTGRIKCPHLPVCGHDCHFQTATISRKIKPYPAIVTADIEPISEHWHSVGRFMITAVLAVIFVFFTLMFFTGFFIWSLLV